MLCEDPRFKAPESGDFTPQNANVIEAEHGLTNPEVIAKLWKKYEENCK